MASVQWLQVAALRLERQHLLGRLPAGRLLDVVNEHVGIHAQVMSAAELQLNARLEGLRRADVQDALWQQRTLVKTWAMRGTLHLLTREGFRDFVPAGSTRGGWHTDAWLRYFEVTRTELEALIDGIRRVLDQKPRTRAQLIAGVGSLAGLSHRRELAEKLASGWGTFLKPAAAQGILCFGPDDGRKVTFVRPDAWLGRASAPVVDPHLATGRLVERFLRLFPGADRDGVRRWWGAAAARVDEAVRAAQLPIVTVEIEGTRGWALAGDVAPLAAAPHPGGVRLLPNFDAYVNDLPRRVDALLPVDYHDRVHRTAGWVSPVVVLDGRVAGTWEIANGRNGDLSVQPFYPWRSVKAELQAETDRIAEFLERPLKLSIRAPLGR